MNAISIPPLAVRPARGDANPGVFPPPHARRRRRRAVADRDAIRSRIDHVDGVAHYHLDPVSHDEESILLLKSLFDVTVEIDDEGERTVRR